MTSQTTTSLLTRRNAVGDIYLNAHLHPEHVLICEWHGFVTQEQIQNALVEVLEVQTQLAIHRVLTDLTHVTGTWMQAVPWLVTEYQAMIRQRMSRSYGAIVLGKSIFSNLSAKQMVTEFVSDELYKTELFSNPDEAFRWLSSFQ